MLLRRLVEKSEILSLWEERFSMEGRNDRMGSQRFSRQGNKELESNPNKQGVGAECSAHNPPLWGLGTQHQPEQEA